MNKHTHTQVKTTVSLIYNLLAYSIKPKFCLVSKVIGDTCILKQNTVQMWWRNEQKIVLYLRKTQPYVVEYRSWVQDFLILANQVISGKLLAFLNLNIPICKNGHMLLTSHGHWEKGIREVLCKLLILFKECLVNIELCLSVFYVWSGL